MLHKGGDPLPLNNSKDDLLNKIDSIPRTSWKEDANSWLTQSICNLQKSKDPNEWKILDWNDKPQTNKQKKVKERLTFVNSWSTVVLFRTARCKTSAVIQI